MGVRRASRTIVIADAGTGHALLRRTQRRDGARSTPRVGPKTVTNDTATATDGRPSLHAMGTDRARAEQDHSRTATCRPVAYAAHVGWARGIGLQPLDMEADMARHKFKVGQLVDFVSPRSGAPAARRQNEIVTRTEQSRPTARYPAPCWAAWPGTRRRAISLRRKADGSPSVRCGRGHGSSPSIE